MEASETDFEPGWWGVHLPGLRPRGGTYALYPYEPLPPPPGLSFDGSFDWLRREPRTRGSIVEDDRNDVARSFPELARFCSARAIALPAPFVAFMGDKDIGRRIRSCTSCFLDPATDVIASPKGAGSLVRFLSDQQGCAFWYLFLAATGTEHCVVASTDYFGSDADEVGEPAGDPDRIVFCAPSFEAFVFRFWLENEYRYASHGYGRSISPTAAAHMRAYGWLPRKDDGGETPNAAGARRRRGPRWLRRLFGW